MRRRSQWGMHQEKKRGHHVVPLLDHVVGPISPILISMDSAWPETDYIKEPLEDSRRGYGETQNTPNGSIDCEDRREDISRAAPIALRFHRHHLL
jgi:hypothetical protein